MNTDGILELSRRMVRTVPNSIPGKLRLTRAAVATFWSGNPRWIPDLFGNRLYCPSLKESIAACLFAYGVYEPETIEAILSRLPENGVYVDVGANIGAIALAISARRPKGTIISVEADPEIAALLLRNLAENHRTNIEVVQCLAGDGDSIAEFHRAPLDRFGGGSVSPQSGASAISLTQRSLDDILDDLEIKDVDVVKLDIEGAELGALRGLRRRLQSPRPPAVIFEFHDWAESRIPGQSAGDAQRLLCSFGYKLYSLGRHGFMKDIPSPLNAGTAEIVALRS